MNSFAGHIQCSKIPGLVSLKDRTLLVHQGTILTMDLCFDIPDGIWALNLENEGLTSQLLDEDSLDVQNEVESRCIPLMS